MAFPTAPVNGQITTVNGIRYSYSAVSNSWTRISSGKFTAAATGPTNPSTGDHWYNTAEDTLYEWTYDGAGYYWLDIQSAFVGGNAGSVISNTTVAGTLTMSGNIVPSANITYDLGSSDYRFRDLWLSGNTIRLGGATISTVGDTLTLTNPGGGTYALSGNAIVGTTTNSYGNVAVAGNVVTANVYADRFFYSNGTAFSSSNFGNTEVAAYLLTNPQGSTYSNTNVAAYLTAGNTVVGTGAWTIPAGGNIGRPANPLAGSIRYNSDMLRYEAYAPSTASWLSFLEIKLGSNLDVPATSPQQLQDLGYASGFYWFKAGQMSAAQYLYCAMNYFESKPWVKVFSSPWAATATLNKVGLNIPWTGFLMETTSGSYRQTGYFGTVQLFNTRSDTATATSGTQSGSRIFIGQAGGHGFYSTAQLPCNWPATGNGLLQATFDGSCGTWPDAIRWGVGTGSVNGSMLTTSTVETWVYWSNF